MKFLLLTLIFSAHAAPSPTLEMKVTYGDRKTSFTVENDTLNFSANESGEADERSVKLSKTQLEELKKKLSALEKVKPSSQACSRAFVTIKAAKFDKKECLDQSKSEIIEFTNWVSRQVK